MSMLAPDHEALLVGLSKRFPNGSITIYDRDLRYLFAGGEGLAAAGLSSATLAGKRLKDAFAPESVQLVPFYRRALAGESVRFDLTVFDRVHSISVAPYGFQGETVTSIMAVAQDITDTKRTAAALAECEARLHLALDVAGVSTWELDVRSGAVQPSGCVHHLLGIGVGDSSPTFHGFMEVVHPEDRSRLEDAMRSSIMPGSGYTADFRVVRADGGIRWLKVRAETLLDDEGTATRMIGAMIDVTMRHELEEKLRRINRGKDDFVVAVASELRQPVQAALVALGVMEAQTSQGSNHEARNVLGRQLLHLSRFVDQLDYAARVFRSEVPLQRRTFDPVESIHAAVNTTLAKFEGQHDIRLSLPWEPVMITADQERIEQVLLTLISNAVKHTPEGGSIDVELTREGDAVLIRVIDSGRGIDPEGLSQIFEMFSGRPREVSGLGLGLAVVRRIVEQHGGEVSASSRGLGHGAEFVVRLPAVTS